MQVCMTPFPVLRFTERLGDAQETNYTSDKAIR